MTIYSADGLKAIVVQAYAAARVVAQEYGVKLIVVAVDDNERVCYETSMGPTLTAGALSRSAGLFDAVPKTGAAGNWDTGHSAGGPSFPVTGVMGGSSTSPTTGAGYAGSGATTGTGPGGGVAGASVGIGGNGGGNAGVSSAGGSVNAHTPFGDSAEARHRLNRLGEFALRRAHTVPVEHTCNASACLRCEASRLGLL